MLQTISKGKLLGTLDNEKKPTGKPKAKANQKTLMRTNLPRKGPGAGIALNRAMRRISA